MRQRRDRKRDIGGEKETKGKRQREKDAGKRQR